MSAGIKLEERDGVADFLHFDDVEQTFTHEIKQNVEPILENCKQNLTGGKNKAGDFYLAGRFPVVIVEAWLRLRNLKMADFKGDILKEFLNDSNHSAFRIWPGRV